MGSDLRDILHVLPVHASPGYALVHLGHRNLAEIGLDLATDESLLVETGSGLDVLGFDGRHVGKGNLHQFVGCEQVAATQKERIDGIGGRLGCLPVLRLLLLEHPNLAVLDRFLVVHDLVEGLDHYGLALDRSSIPPP